MDTQLGLFEGRSVQACTLKLTGSTHERIGKMVLDEEIFIVCKARVEKISHGDEKVARTDQFTRGHKAAITAMFVVDRGQGEAMLSEAAMLADEAFGIESMFSQGGNPPPEEPPHID